MIGNPETEATLQKILEEMEHDLEPLRTQYSEASWKASISGTDKDYSAVEDAETNLRLKLSSKELYEELGKLLSDPGVQNILLRRWAALMRHEIAPNRLPEETIVDLVSRQKKIEVKMNTFRPEVSGQSLTMNQVHEILRTSTDMSLRRDAWEASKKIGPIIAEELVELVRARNIAARSLGFPDHYRMLLELQEIDEARLFSQLGRFADLSEDPFRRMRANLDRLIADKYKLEAIDLAPWHYSDPFFQEVPPVYGVNTDPVYEGRGTMEWTQKYFEGVGLSIESILDKGDYLEKDGKHPHAYCDHIDRNGDVRVLMNLKDNTYWASTSLHEFGHAVYELNIDRSLPHTLRIPAHTAVTEAVAMFFGRLARDIEWMASMFRLKGSEIKELQKPLAQERKIEKAILGRWILVMVHFERGFYRDPDYDQQQRWWDLVQRFQLVRPVAGREKEADWAVKSHIADAPVYYHNYLLGEWIASQFHEAIIRDLKLEEPPVFHNMHELGDWFKEKVFTHGAYWEFTELVRNVTGSSPQPDAFINQFFEKI
ncbi:MAG: M2 family metallopeptidase [Candidatus Electryonea clarkiae]|nr:M2 family metallopeptidase [Candidatus Electryonea clarkiae]MDP8287250.1 M2 family metallopeptidase [Candidatus Electryonea clarkiae]